MFILLHEIIKLVNLKIEFMTKIALRLDVNLVQVSLLLNLEQLSIFKCLLQTST